jgi:hypothetical protein
VPAADYARHLLRGWRSCGSTSQFYALLLSEQEKGSPLHLRRGRVHPSGKRPLQVFLCPWLSHSLLHILHARHSLGLCQFVPSLNVHQECLTEWSECIHTARDHDPRDAVLVSILEWSAYVHKPGLIQASKQGSPILPRDPCEHCHSDGAVEIKSNLKHFSCFPNKARNLKNHANFTTLVNPTYFHQYMLKSHEIISCRYDSGSLQGDAK